MSDAIVLDVAESPTIALDAGTADPVARDEIAALQAEVAELGISLTITNGDLTIGLTRTEE